MKWNNILILFISICVSQIAFGQKASKDSDKIIKISGKVLTKNNVPVMGAVFYIDNIKTSHRSKSNGSYKLKISSTVRKLKVTSSVYGSQEMLIDGQKKINFTLPGGDDITASLPEDNDLEEGLPESNNETRRRARKMNTYNDIYQMIRGEVSGVVVSGKSILIEQGHSFFGSSEPLYLVNGVIVNSFDFISPMDVKSIEVLKGSSAAIYGIRGSNGVISITLLNGSEEVQ